MKKKNTIIKSLIVFGMFALLASCSEDESSPVIDFASISSNIYEEDGTQTVTIPLRNAGSVNGLSVSFGGTATEDEDYELIGITSDGVQISIIDDSDFEENETVRVQLVSSSGELSGNVFHTVNIISNCEDSDGLDVSQFAGLYNATEKYGETPGTWYGPYEIELVQDEEDPNKFHFDNLYDSGCDAFMIFDYEAGTVYFPDQAPCNSPLTNSSGTFVIDNCNGSVLNINLNFDGSDWLYTFEKLL